MSSQQRKPSMYARYVNLIIGVILAIFLIIFGSQSISDGVMGLLLALVSYAAAIALIYVSFLNYYKLGYKSIKAPEKTFTVFKCPTCGYQITKDFSYGDYVGKSGDVCPKDGSVMVIDKIYTASA
ncbi:MAG: hypothetical protein ACP5T2_00710 [Thermoprotei archaeon]